MVWITTPVLTSDHGMRTEEKLNDSSSSEDGLVAKNSEHLKTQFTSQLDFERELAT